MSVGNEESEGPAPAPCGSGAGVVDRSPDVGGARPVACAGGRAPAGAADDGSERRLLVVDAAVGGERRPVHVGREHRPPRNGAHRSRPALDRVGEVGDLGISKVDDHNAPAIALSAAHPHLLAFYTQHGTDNVMRYRTVDRQTLAMGEEQELRFSGRLTYAQVIQSPTQLTLVTRIEDDRWHYRTSGDFGATWGTSASSSTATATARSMR